MQKEITVGEKKFTVKELLYKDIVKFSQGTPEEVTKQLLFLSTGITEEEFNTLSMKEGLEIQKVINELNGVASFQMPLTDK